MCFQSLLRSEGNPGWPAGPRIVEVVCQSASEESDCPRPGTLVAISSQGLCLQANHRFGVGEVVVVEVPERPGLPEGLRLWAQVVSADRTPVLGDWVFGCAVVRRELNAEELRALAGETASPDHPTPRS
jgi:hypothetical protein